VKSATTIRRTGISLALVGMAMAAAVSPAAAGDMPVETKLVLRNSAPAFHGKVRADDDRCVAGRKVRLFRVKPGDDKLLGKDLADAKGYWEVLKGPKSGVYYAKTKEITAGGEESSTVLCLKAKSDKVVVD
jgi:hypothetical protein